MQKVFSVLATAVITTMLSVTPILAAKYETWGEVTDAMETVLNGAYSLYISGDANAAKDEVDEAYYAYYEKLGFEKLVKAYISGDRAAVVEYQFTFVKKVINDRADASKLRSSFNELIRLLHEDADKLDSKTGGKTENAVSQTATDTASPTSSTVLVNGKNVAFDACNIGGNNYFKLRDIGAALNFGVTWDGAKNMIVIDTGERLYAG